ncbi:MAG: rhomboid family intramembrane serine protease, partial [Ignavibacteriaceae bacterium]|nr:rhomboid family intramembrane serine protease [Ignavibacteriaceae bacterium]
VFEFLSINTSGFVAHLAHIGGALTALIFILVDKKNNFNFNRLFSSFKKSGSSPGQFSSGFRKPKNPFEKDVQEAKYYDINDKNNDESIEVSQEEIDRILDKISQSGYQKLTDHEKKVLFEASKKK